MAGETKTILLAGVGGQGTILAADLIARCAMINNDDVKLSEIHGMAQRGGAVTTVVRIGEHVQSMVADIGRVDYLVSFETTEALRNISFVAEDGAAIVADETIISVPALSGKVPMPSNPQETLTAAGAVIIPAVAMAKEAGSSKAVKVVLLGALSHYLPYSAESWKAAIEGRVPEKFKEVNLKAFDLGRAFAEGHQN